VVGEPEVAGRQRYTRGAVTPSVAAALNSVDIEFSNGEILEISPAMIGVY